MEPMAAFLNLQQDEIHVWLAPLDGHGDRYDYWTGLLSEDERQRSAMFHFDVHRLRFIAARAALRILLGRYLNTSPQVIRFLQGQNGKPRVPWEPVQFNLSHSED